MERRLVRKVARQPTAVAAALAFALGAATLEGGAWAQQGRSATPAAPPSAAGEAAAPTPEPGQKPRRRKAASAAPAADVIRCEGLFGKESTHDALAQAFGAENLDFTQIDGPGGTRLNATVAFPNDPKRRLEILWHDEGTRARPSSIVVGGRSAWVGPKAVRIGTPMADVAKQNGKPFKLSGFDGEDGGTASDWQNGAFGKLAGDCGMSVRFEPDPKAPPAARAKVSGDGPFVSSDAALWAVKPKVVEFFVGYGE